MHICKKKMQKFSHMWQNGPKPHSCYQCRMNLGASCVLVFFNPSASNMFIFFYMLFTRYSSHVQDKRPVHFFSVPLLLKRQWKGKRVRQRQPKELLQKTTTMTKNQTKKKNKKRKKKGGRGQQTKLGFVLQFPIWVVPLQLAIRMRLLFPCLIRILVLHLNNLFWNVGLWFSNITEYFQRGEIASENKTVLV